MKATLTFVFCIASTLISYAQSRGTIFTQVKNTQQKPLEGITVQLLRQKDSALVKLAITDAEGKATLVSLAFGDYYLRYVGNGFETTYSAPFTLSEQQGTYQVPPQTLQPQAKDIGAVTVTAKKPFIQRLSDRTVLNVESSILSAGSSGFELLERAPGVVIDQNDVISLSGKQGVLVMIDGKISPLSGADLANYLRGLPSGSIERIDLITNPSAKYDAAGNAGIIDIRLKKDQRLGTNGTLNTFYGQGVYAKVGAGVTLNYRNKKVNVFGSNNTAYRKGLNQLLLDRNFYTNAGQFTGSDYKDNYGRFPILSNNFRIGADYFPSKRTVIGIVLNGSGVGIERMNDNNAVVFDQQGKPASTFYTIATNNDF
ncbi:MAG TPA: TonB-dependent receptor, partial [Chitinophagaceae bacterium]|nr:TonB-dependent receptor [Chitinophagaceae bacterium]